MPRATHRLGGGARLHSRHGCRRRLVRANAAAPQQQPRGVELGGGVGGGPVQLLRPAGLGPGRSYRPERSVQGRARQPDQHRGHGQGSWLGGRMARAASRSTPRSPIHTRARSPGAAVSPASAASRRGCPTRPPALRRSTALVQAPRRSAGRRQARRRARAARGGWRHGRLRVDVGGGEAAHAASRPAATGAPCGGVPGAWRDVIEVERHGSESAGQARPRAARRSAAAGRRSGTDLRAAPALADHRHEVGVAVPARHEVHVQVIGDAGAGRPAQVDADVDPLRLVGLGAARPRPRCVSRPTSISSSSREPASVATCRCGTTIRWPLL